MDDAERNRLAEEYKALSILLNEAAIATVLARYADRAILDQKYAFADSALRQFAKKAVKLKQQLTEREAEFETKLANADRYRSETRERYNEVYAKCDAFRQAYPFVVPRRKYRLVALDARFKF